MKYVPMGAQLIVLSAYSYYDDNWAWISQSHPKLFCYDTLAMGQPTFLSKLALREMDCLDYSERQHEFGSYLHFFHAFEHLLIVVNVRSNSIGCFDLVTRKWFVKKTEIILPEIANGKYWMQRRFRSCQSEDAVYFYNEERFHMMKMIDLVPDRLFLVQSRYYRKLIRGYLRDIVQITVDIEMIIFHFANPLCV